MTFWWAPYNDAKDGYLPGVALVFEPEVSVDWSKADLGRLSRQHGWSLVADGYGAGESDYGVTYQDPTIWRVHADGTITH